MSIQDLLFTAIGGLAGAVSTLAAGLVFIYKKYEKRTAQLVDLAKDFARVQNENLTKLKEIIEVFERIPSRRRPKN